jgi:hypothetical protein
MKLTREQILERRARRKEERKRRRAEQQHRHAEHQASPQLVVRGIFAERSSPTRRHELLRAKLRSGGHSD